MEDTRQVIGGKIGQQPQNVRVDLTETESGVVIFLHDEGEFLESQPGDSDHEEGQAGKGEEDGRSDHVQDGAHEEASNSGGMSHVTLLDTAVLEAELNHLTGENTGLHMEVSELREKVDDGKRKYKQLWKDSCEQLVDYDPGWKRFE